MFRILHLSDLHARESSRWSTDALLREAKSVFLKESETANIDVVAFTGDIAHSGRRQEYEIAEEWIGDCLTSPSGLNLSSPQLLFVPGNHDVDRSAIRPSASAIQNELSRATSQEDIARHLTDVESRELLFARHAEYVNFCKRIVSDDSLALPSWTRQFPAGDRKITFEGYCTSWLSRGDDDHRHLLVGQPQFTDVMSGRENSDLLIALMHHPLSDLMPFDEDHCRGILRANHDILLRGHLHSPDGVSYTTPTGSYVELAAGALHESNAFQNRFEIIDIQDDFRTLTVRTYLWSSGGWIRDRNLYPHSLDGDGEIELRQRTRPTSYRRTTALFTDGTTTAPPVNCESAPASCGPKTSTTREGDSAEGDVLLGFPRFTEPCLQSHRVTRQLAQERALLLLEQKRHVEVRAGWGTHPLSFIGTVVERWKAANHLGIALHVRCGGLSSGEELQKCIESHSLLTSSEFANALRKGPPAIIVLDDVTVRQSLAPPNRVSVQDTISTFLDFCPNASFVLLSYHHGDAGRSDDGVVLLEPLDPADTRAYMVSHGTTAVQLDSIVDYDRVHRTTGGLPLLIDAFIDALAFTNLNGAIETVGLRASSTRAEVPRVVAENVSRLSESSDDISVRAMSLLSVLCILENGEVLSTIGRIVPQSRFWPQHAKHLQDAGLLDVIEQTVGTRRRRTEMEKILRVPRVVRDHVLEALPPSERIRFVTAAASVYFGADWRTGSLRMRLRDSRAIASGLPTMGNELAILEEIVSLAIRGDANAPCSEVEVMRLVLKYLHQLHAKGLYGECYAAARDLLGIIGEAEFDDEITEIKLVAGQCARMIGEHAAAVSMLEAALPSARLSGVNGRIADVLESLALTHESLGNEAEATLYAEEILALVPKDSSQGLQAAATIAGFRKDDDERRSALLRLESRARSKRLYIVADNIALKLAADSKSVEETLRHLAAVRSRRETQYNYIRATIRRVDTLLKSGRLSEITSLDVQDLETSYSIAFSQRMRGIFNWCHRVTWDYLEAKGDRQGLADLFRYSSFIWRLSGDSESEIAYASRLSAGTTSLSIVSSAPFAAILRYCNTRIAAIRGNS